MEAKNITLSTKAVAAIERLQHPRGIYDFYATTLTRLFNYILDQSDEIGMSDTEAVHTLRVLRYLKDDITHIAGKGDSPLEIRIEADMEGLEKSIENPSTEGAAEKIETTFGGLTLKDVQEFENEQRTPPGDQLDEPREMLADVKRAWQRVNELQVVISEAISHAQNAGEKYNSVISDLADVNGDMEATAATLDAIMAIDPDNYEPKELTETEKAAQFVQRSRNALTYGKKLLDDALDHAVRADFKPLSRRVTVARGLTVTAVNHIAELTEELNAITKEDEEERRLL